MTPDQIHAELKKNGFISSDVARALGVSRNSVSNIIHSRAKSRRIAEAIAKLTGKSTEDLWPGLYRTGRKQASQAEIAQRMNAAMARLHTPSAA